MAIYHFSVKAISRADGRSAIASAAYRSGEKLIDEKQQKEQDYTRKTGVEFKKIYAPENAKAELLDRQSLWNIVEKVENRKNSVLAREFEVAFPQELNAEQRQNLLDDLCKKIVERHNVIVDAVIHAPHTKGGTDERNYHAHIMFTSRQLDKDTGEFSKNKFRDFNKEKSSETITTWRKDFADLANHHLEKNSFDARIDHRSYADREINLEPTWHEGNAVTAMKRKYEREQLKPVEERNPKIIMPTIALENNAIKARNAEREQILKGLDQEIVFNFGILSDLKRSQSNFKNKSDGNIGKEPKGILESKPEPFNPIIDRLHKELDQAQSKKAVLSAEIEEIQQTLKNMEANKPKEKVLGLWGNSDFYQWKEKYLELEITATSQNYKLEATLGEILAVETKIKQAKNPQNIEEKTKREINFNDLYKSMNSDQKQAYNILKIQLEQNFNGPNLENKLAQVQAKFIEKYQENPNFEVPKQEQQRPQQQDFVRGASKNDHEKGR